MSDLLVRDLPLSLKAKISEAANSNGRSMSEEVKARLVKDFGESGALAQSKVGSVFDEIRAVFAETLMSDEEHDEFMRVIERGRQDFGRPPPDFE